MISNFRITGIRKNTYDHLFELNETELWDMGALRMTVDKKPGYPCRVSLEDAKVGEEVILMPYEHHKTVSPYQAMGPVFIRKNAQQANLEVNEIPKMLEHRLLSLRAYDLQGMMVNAKTLEGVELRTAISEIFKNERANYIHIHNASPGCYNCHIQRL